MENSDRNIGKTVGQKRKNRQSPDQGDLNKQRKVRPALLSLSESDEEFNRNRTPSGTVIPKIATIRGYFSPSSEKKEKVSEQSPLNKNSIVSQAEKARHCTTAVARNLKDRTGVKKLKGKQGQKAIRRETIDRKATASKQQQSDTANSSTVSETHSSSVINSFDLSSPDEQTLQAIAQVIGNKKRSQPTVPYEIFKKTIMMEDQREGEDIKHQPEAEETQSDSSSEAEMDVAAPANISSKYDGDDENEGDSKTITLSLVYEMFKELKKDVTDIKNSKEDIKKECTAQFTETVSEIVQTECKDTFDKVTADLKHCQLKNEILTDVCNKMSEDITDLTQKIENLELNTAKRMVIVSGWKPAEPDTAKEDLINELEVFIKQHLDTEVVIDDCFNLGKSTVLEFQCIADRRAVLRNKKKLKNVGGGNIYINEYTPIATAEKRRRERYIIKEIGEISRTEGTEIKVEYTSAGLTVQGEPYRKRVSPPTPKELLQLSLEDLDHVLNLKPKKSKVFTSQGSKFTAYSAEVTSHQQIRELYMKLKLTKTTAKHIVCAYIIPGPLHTCRDFHDDGEPGSGRVLLQLMQERQLENRVIFVVRRYGGVKLGSTRFEGYRQAAISVLEDELNASVSSNNPIHEVPLETLEQHSARPPTVPPYRSHRGRGRFPNRRRASTPYQSRTVTRRQQISTGGRDTQHHYNPRGLDQGRGGQIRGAHHTTQSERQESRYQELMQNSRYQNDYNYNFANPVNRLEQFSQDWSNQRNHQYYT